MVKVTDRMDAKQTYAFEFCDIMSYAKQITVANIMDCPQRKNNKKIKCHYDFVSK